MLPLDPLPFYCYLNAGLIQSPSVKFDFASPMPPVAFVVVRSAAVHPLLALILELPTISFSFSYSPSLFPRPNLDWMSGEGPLSCWLVVESGWGFESPTPAPSYILLARKEGDPMRFTLSNSYCNLGLWHSVFASSSNLNLTFTVKQLILLRNSWISRSFFEADSGTKVFLTMLADSDDSNMVL